MLDRSIEYQRMAAVEASHWWYRALHQRVLATLDSAFLGRPDLAILDVGCGTGGLMRRLQEHRPASRLRGIDLSEHAVEIARQRGFEVLRGDLRQVPELLSGATVDAIIMNDVSYFVPLADWPAVLNGYAKILAPGGIVILNVPAFPAFRGMHDLAVGIGYRLRRREVPQLYDPTRFIRLETRCWPFLLSPLIWATRRRQRRSLAKNAAQTLRSDVELPSGLVNALLFGVMRLENRLHASLARWGSSLFIVLRRAETNPSS